MLVAGVVAAAAGKAFIGSSDALMAIFAQALAGGAVLALVAHAMIPVALEEGGSLVVLPTVAGFLFRAISGFGQIFCLKPLDEPENPMNVSNADLSTTLDRILDTAANNLRVAKILIQLGLDPDNITSDAIIQSPAGNCAGQHHPGQHVRPGRRHLLCRYPADADDGAAARRQYDRLCILRRLWRARRRRQDLSPVSPVAPHQRRSPSSNAQSREEGTRGGTGRYVDGMAEAVHERAKIRKGDILFKKDDAANEMFLTVTGEFLVTEIDVKLPPGRLMGELGFLSPDNRRTATVKCTEDGQVLTITYEKLLELYFQNPQFGYYFLVLTSQRLLENIWRLEGIVAQNKIALQSAAAANP